MKTKKFGRLALVMLTLTLPITATAQLFQSLGLGFNGGERQGICSQPRMHIEGNVLYVCTCRGLYAKDLREYDSTWQLVGFDGIPLQDYARRGDDILALRYNEDGAYLLLSHDGGQTYEDVTPDIFRNGKHERLPCLAQHPANSCMLLVSSLNRGIFRTTDFGQTWEQLTEFMYGNTAASFIGFHPIHPGIIYNSGEGDIFEGHINISYDGGKTWNDHDNSLGFPGDNCVHQVAFHPINPDRWLAGGEGCVFLSDDNGMTWSVQNYWSDESRSAYWFFSAFDNEHPDTVYIAGSVNKSIKLICSTDGGHSWHPSQSMTAKIVQESVNDLQQYHDHLFIYTETDIYAVSKAELIAQSTAAIRSVTSDTEYTPTFDLHGRRIVEPQHGIYIKNGSKIVK